MRITGSGRGVDKLALSQFVNETDGIRMIGPARTSAFSLQVAGVQADLPRHLKGQGIHLTGFQSSGGHLTAVSHSVFQQGLGHLRAGGVACTNEQHMRLLEGGGNPLGSGLDYGFAP